MIQNFADWLVFSIIGLDNETAFGSAVNFFVYDSIKILLLLFLISALMGIVNAYFPVERLRNYLSSHRLYGLQYLLASLFGAITPFCSCSSIPLFIGFYNVNQKKNCQDGPDSLRYCSFHNRGFHIFIPPFSVVKHFSSSEKDRKSHNLSTQFLLEAYFFCCQTSLLLFFYNKFIFFL